METERINMDYLKTCFCCQFSPRQSQLTFLCQTFSGWNLPRTEKQLRTTNSRTYLSSNHRVWSNSLQKEQRVTAKINQSVSSEKREPSPTIWTRRTKINEPEALGAWVNRKRRGAKPTGFQPPVTLEQKGKLPVLLQRVGKGNQPLVSSPVIHHSKKDILWKTRLVCPGNQQSRHTCRSQMRAVYFALQTTQETVDRKYTPSRLQHCG